MKLVLRWLCLIYTALILCGSLVAIVIWHTTSYGVLSGVGCNFYDALIYGIDCRGFIGATAVEILVGLPLLLFQLSIFASSSPAMLALVSLFWLPLFIALYSILKYLTVRLIARAASGAT